MKGERRPHVERHRSDKAPAIGCAKIVNNSAVVISADKGVQYEAVVKAMDALQKAGVQRVGLSVKQGG